MKLTLATPQKKLLENLEASSIRVFGYKGELEVLPGHAPLMTTLDTGILCVATDDIENSDKKIHFFSISWGYLEVQNEEVNILAQTAESAEEIDYERAKRAYDKALKDLSNEDLSPESFNKMLSKLKKADIRTQLKS